MPMYRSRPFESRLAIDTNRVDIAQWCGLDEDDVEAGMYYTADGAGYYPQAFDRDIEEIG